MDILIEKNRKLSLQLQQTRRENSLLNIAKYTLSKDIKKLKQEISESQNHHTTEITTIQDQLNQLQQDYEEAQDRNEQYAQKNVEINDCIIKANREIEEKGQTITRLKNQLQETTLVIDKLNRSVENLTLELDQNSKNRNTLVNLQNNLNTVLLQIHELETLREDDSNKIKSLTEKLTVATANLEETSNKKDEVINKNEELKESFNKLNVEFKSLRKSHNIATEQLLLALEKKTEFEMKLKGASGNEETELNVFGDLKLALMKSIVTAGKSLEKLKKLPDGVADDGVALEELPN